MSLCITFCVQILCTLLQNRFANQTIVAYLFKLRTQSQQLILPCWGDLDVDPSGHGQQWISLTRCVWGLKPGKKNHMVGFRKGQWKIHRVTSQLLIYWRLTFRCWFNLIYMGDFSHKTVKVDLLTFLSYLGLQSFMPQYHPVVILTKAQALLQWLARRQSHRQQALPAKFFMKLAAKNKNRCLGCVLVAAPGCTYDAFDIFGLFLSWNGQKHTV